MKQITGMGNQSNAKYNPNNLKSAPPFGTSNSKPAMPHEWEEDRDGSHTLVGCPGVAAAVHGGAA